MLKNKYDRVLSKIKTQTFRRALNNVFSWKEISRYMMMALAVMGEKEFKARDFKKSYFYINDPMKYLGKYNIEELEKAYLLIYQGYLKVARRYGLMITTHWRLKVPWYEVIERKKDGKIKSYEYYVKFSELPEFRKRLLEVAENEGLCIYE